MASANATTTYEGGNVQSKQAASQNVQEQSMAQHIANSPAQQQPTIRCGICNSLHNTNDCQLLASLSVNERLQRLGEKGLCFHCFQRGHTAKFCTQKPRCQLCNRLHNTLMHQRRDEFLQGMQQSQMEFQPMTQNAPPAQDATASTKNSQVSAPQSRNVAPQIQQPRMQRLNTRVLRSNHLRHRRRPIPSYDWRQRRLAATLLGRSSQSAFEIKGITRPK